MMDLRFRRYSKIKTRKNRIQKIILENLQLKKQIQEMELAINELQKQLGGW